MRGPRTRSSEDGRLDSFSDLDDVPTDLAALVADLSGPPVAPRMPGRSMLRVPMQLGRYTVLHPVGRGGMGEVFAAFDRELDRKVAIKVVRGLSRVASPQAMQRIRHEAQALARLSHPNVVAVHEVGVHDPGAAFGDDAQPGFVYLAMEYVHGATLRQWWTATPRSTDALLGAIVQLGHGLVAVHAAGLVHRDLKPENVMVGDDGRVRIMDFGVAQREVDHGPTPTSDAGSSSGARPPLLGTPGYMAPEQLVSPDVGPAADQFALGVIAWEAFFGERPFSGDSVSGMRVALLAGRRNPPRRPRAMPRRIRRVIERALEVDPAARWPDVASMIERLSATRSRRWAAPAIAACVVGTAMWLGGGERSACDRDALLAGAWDDRTRDAVHDAMLASGASFAEASWRHVAARLDAHADAWMAIAEPVCASRSTALPEALAVAQTVCLARAGQQLAAVTDLLARADVDVVERAHGIVDRLAAPDRCADVERLARSVPPPEDPEVARASATIAERLADMRVQIDAGAFTRVAGEAGAVVEHARAVGDPATLSRALLESGRVAAATSELPRAEDELREAYRIATSIGDDETAAFAAVELTIVVGGRAARYDEGLAWAFQAEARLPRVRGLGVDAPLAVAVGNIHLAKGEIDAGIARLAAALEEHQRTHAGEDLALADLLDAQGRGLRTKGELDAALDVLEQALEIRSGLLSPDHPAVLASHLALASVYVTAYELDRAEEHYRRAHAIAVAAFGEGHIAVTKPLEGLGLVHAQRNEASEAIPLHRRVLEIRERELGPEHPDVATSLHHLGLAHASLGDVATARALVERSLAVLERAVGSDHPGVAARLRLLGELALREKRWGDAEPLFDRALEITERIQSAEHPTAGILHLAIAAALHEQRQDAAAKPEAMRGREIVERALGAEHPDVGNAWHILGKIELGLGNRSAAKAALLRAQDLLARPAAHALPETLADIASDLAAAD